MRRTGRSIFTQGSRWSFPCPLSVLRDRPAMHYEVLEGEANRREDGDLLVGRPTGTLSYHDCSQFGVDRPTVEIGVGDHPRLADQFAVVTDEPRMLDQIGAEFTFSRSVRPERRDVCPRSENARVEERLVGLCRSQDDPSIGDRFLDGLMDIDRDA